jgi:hypothetical protein
VAIGSTYLVWVWLLPTLLIADLTRRRIVADAMVSLPAGARDTLRRTCEDLMAAELSRLARRVPALRPGQLRHVDAALARVIGDLVLDRAHAVRNDQLAVLFDLTDAR